MLVPDTIKSLPEATILPAFSQWLQTASDWMQISSCCRQLY